MLENYYANFIDFMKSEKNCSASTVSSYWTDFYIFKEFLSKQKINITLDNITTSVLRQYLAYIKLEKGYANGTIRRKIHSLSSFFKYLIDIEVIDKNPMLPIHAPKQENHTPIYFDEKEIERLLSAPERYARFPHHILRDRVILMTLFYTGCRRAELLAINFDDINFGTRVLTIRQGKGKKDRLIPLADELNEILWEYLQTRLPLKDNALIISDNDTRMSIGNLQTLFKRYLKKCGLEDKGLTIHKTRHTFATTLLKNGADLIAIKDLLGHEDLNSTKIYVHTDTRHLRKCVDDLKF